MSYRDKFIERLILDGVPASWGMKYISKRVGQFLDDHPDFADFFHGIGRIVSQKYPHLSSLFEKDIKDARLVMRGPHSVFNVLIKLYNYGLSKEEALEYIEDCHSLYESILSHPFEIKRCDIAEGTVTFLLEEITGMDVTVKGVGRISFFLTYDDGIPETVYHTHALYELEEDTLSIFDFGETQKKCEILIARLLNESFGLKPGEWKTKDLPSPQAIVDASWVEEDDFKKGTEA